MLHAIRKSVAITADQPEWILYIEVEFLNFGANGD